MRAQNERSTSFTRTTRSAATRRTPESAFTPAFLSAHRTRARDRRDSPGHLPEPARDLRDRALFAGPWEVEPVQPADRTDGSLHAVVRRAEPRSEGGGALSALATPSRLRLKTLAPSGPRRRHGIALHDGRTFLGHLTPKLCPGKAEEEAGLLWRSTGPTREPCWTTRRLVAVRRRSECP
jgi:hypothetical protein